MILTENEIIKALERMSDEDQNGFSSDILGVIQRQKAEKQELEFELIRSRNEMKAWKIRASWYKEKSSNLECKNSELEIELKAMRGAANSYKAEIERLEQTPKCIYSYDGETIEYCVEGPCSVEKTIESIKSEARKEFAERLKKKVGLPKGTILGTMVYTDDIDNLLAEMEREGK